MTFPKKILAAFSMAAILGVAVFAAPTEITYMCWYNNTETEAQGNQVLIDKYNASQDKVHVTMMAIPRDGYETKVNTMAAAGQLPDCTQLSEAMTIEFAANNLLADVSAMYLADAAPLKSLTFTYNGKPVGYSSGNEVLLLYYNKKLFDAAKLPYPPASADKAWTWKQFVDTAKKLTKDKNGKTADQKGFDAKNIVQYGADFNSPSRPCRCSADLYVKEKVAPSFADKNAMPSLDLTLLTGKIAMATSGQWEIGVSLKNSLKDGLEYGIGVLPKMKKAVTYNTGAPYGIFKPAKHLDASMDFIKWWADEKNQWEAITNGTLMPVMSKWYKDEAAMRQWVVSPPRPEFSLYKTAVIDYAMNNAIQVPWYYFNGYTGFNDILDSGIDAVWNGKATAKDYIAKIMPKLQKYFDEHKSK